MRPTQLKPGDQVCKVGSKHTYVFVRRIVSGRSTSGKTKNIFRCEAFRGLDGPNDEGLVEMSDYEVSRHCSRIKTTSKIRAVACAAAPIMTALNALNEPASRAIGLLPICAVHVQAHNL